MFNAASPSTASPEDGEVTPRIVKEAFNIGDAVGKNSKSLQAVAQFLGQYYNPDDLATFFSKNDLPANKVAKVIGTNKPSNPGVEAQLDIEYIMGTANDIATYFVYTAHLYQNQEPFLTWLENTSNMTAPPAVYSVSYGDVESSVSEEYAERCNTEFKKLGSRGLSILFAR